MEKVAHTGKSKLRQSLKDFTILFLILIVADTAFLLYMFYEPMNWSSGALALLFLWLIIAAGFAVLGIVLIVLNRIGAGIALFINIGVLLGGMIGASNYSTLRALRMTLIEYEVKANDTTYVLSLNKQDNGFYLFYTGPGFEASYCWGDYDKLNDSTYILDVDTTSWRPTRRRFRQFVVAGDTLKGFREEDLVMKRTL